MKKYLFCGQCQKYPDKVYSKEVVFTDRQWDGECYEGYSTETADDTEIWFCSECDTELENKE